MALSRRSRSACNRGPFRPHRRCARLEVLLARDGIRIAYTTLRRFVHDELRWREPPVTVHVDDPPPADEAQIDFGEMGYVTDEEARRRKLWVLVVTLSMSRYMFVWPTFAQTCAALIEGLEAAWRFFGGMHGLHADGPRLRELYQPRPNPLWSRRPIKSPCDLEDTWLRNLKQTDKILRPVCHCLDCGK